MTMVYQTTRKKGKDRSWSKGSQAFQHFDTLRDEWWKLRFCWHLQKGTFKHGNKKKNTRTSGRKKILRIQFHVILFWKTF